MNGVRTLIGSLSTTHAMPPPERHRGADRSHVRQLARHQPQVADARSQSLLIEARALDENPGHEHHDQDGIGHPRRADSGEFVA